MFQPYANHPHTLTSDDTRRTHLQEEKKRESGQIEIALSSKHLEIDGAAQRVGGAAGTAVRRLVLYDVTHRICRVGKVSW